MTKVISIDEIEIELEKQNPESSCKWCVYIRVRKKDRDQLLFMFKTNHKTLTKFTYNSVSIVTKSKKTLSEQSEFIANLYSHFAKIASMFDSTFGALGESWGLPLLEVLCSRRFLF
mgnify:CR=1 FL=1